jgi:ribosomal protein S18 acetylase RimI-like enzyme
VIELRREPIDGPAATRLIDRVQQEYVARYGGPDTAPVSAGEFAPPHGVFFVAYRDGEPVGCAGLRLVEPGLAEIKRMYVDPAQRKQGIARRLLTELEASAGELRARTIRLETGTEQPEAVALYGSAGYTRIPGYGIHADDPRNVCMAKSLGSAAP